MIAGCQRDPTQQITLNEGGIHVLYAVCADHGRAIFDGVSFAEPVDISRGMLGLP